MSRPGLGIWQSPCVGERRRVGGNTNVEMMEALPSGRAPLPRATPVVSGIHAQEQPSSQTGSFSPSPRQAIV